MQVISKSTSWHISSEPPQAERIKPHFPGVMITLVHLYDEDNSYELTADDGSDMPVRIYLFSVVSAAVRADARRDLVNRGVKFFNTSRFQSINLAR